MAIDAAGGGDDAQRRRRRAGDRRRRGLLGLYHFAVLLPDRASLARFLKHLARLGAQAGMSDHLVSEAIYLQDPDNLGIEVYSDRPRSDWKRAGRELMMATDVVTDVPAALSRRLDPRAGAALVWGTISAGRAPNVIPSTGIGSPIITSTSAERNSDRFAASTSSAACTKWRWWMRLAASGPGSAAAWAANSSPAKASRRGSTGAAPKP